MQITLTKDVSTSFVNKGKNGYSVAEVSYNGSKFPFKVMSFLNPAVFEKLKNAKEGQSFEVDVGKNDKGYDQWNGIKEIEPGDRKTESAPSKAPWTPGADPRETKVERDARQRLIVRQSSLAQAVEYAKLTAANDWNAEDIMGQADRFCAWVYEAPDLFDEPNDLTGA